MPPSDTSALSDNSALRRHHPQRGTYRTGYEIVGPVRRRVVSHTATGGALERGELKPCGPPRLVLKRIMRFPLAAWGRRCRIVRRVLSGTRDGVKPATPAFSSFHRSDARSVWAKTMSENPWVMHSLNPVWLLAECAPILQRMIQRHTSDLRAV